MITTDSGIPVDPWYGPPGEPGPPLGQPGEPPYIRGPYASMYRERLWTMRQYAGFGSAEDTNARFRYLLSQGQTALSVAFDLPTQLGYDSSHELASNEVGRVGVAIDTADDMAAVFDGLPLEDLSVNFTINATAPIILAFYIVAAERRGVDPARLAGTLQNDILKEFLARKLYVFPPQPSLQLTGDVVEYCAAGTAALQPDLHHRLPRPRGRAATPSRRSGSPWPRPSPTRSISPPAAWPSTRSRRGCPSTSPASSTCSRRRPRSARPVACGTRSPPSGSARPTRTRAGCVSSPAARAPR